MPVFQQRPIPDFPLGNIPLREHHAGLAHHGLCFHPHAWIAAADLAAMLAAGADTLVDSAGTALAWRPPSASPNSLSAAASLLIVHPWDLLRANQQLLATATGSNILGDLHPSAVIEGHLTLGHGSRILPGVFIEGNVVIGSHCKIGPNCYIRGATSIGDHCHVGQAVEIKNSILLAGTNVGHLSYVGDSVLGAGVNFGAGTMTSNLRHDGANHRAMAAGTLVDTGLRKFGCIVGDAVHTGINTSIYPGRQLWPGTSTLPGEVVRHDLPSRSQSLS
jgi:bifunctional UDP-N-acetylglucosamine pyrophosphorylase/glucosamine-1-phosphate N-acetyltransferase